MKKILYLILLLTIMILPNMDVFALNEVNIYFFHKSTCDICEQERIYLTALKEKYPNMRIYSYDVTDSHNYELMKNARSLFNDTREGVPYTVIGDTTFHGFNQASKCKMQKAVYQASLNKYENKLGQQLNLTYRDDLEGTVEEYKENDNYTIEEAGEGGTHPVYEEYSSTWKKYQASIILISSGLILLIIYLIIKIIEKRRYR